MQLCHVNFIKPYYARSSGTDPAPSLASAAVAASVDPPPALCLTADTEEMLEVPDDGILRGRLKNSCAKLDDLLKNLPEMRRKEFIHLIKSYPCLFADTPSCAHFIEHDIDVGDAHLILQHFYHISPDKCKYLEEEVRYMLINNIAEPCASTWSKYHVCLLAYLMVLSGPVLICVK